MSIFEEKNRVLYFEYDCSHLSMKPCWMCEKPIAYWAIVNNGYWSCWGLFKRSWVQILCLSTLTDATAVRDAIMALRQRAFLQLGQTIYS